MRTILIDPETRTIQVHEFTGNYQKIQQTIGCSCFTTLNLGGETNDSIFVDDEGLLKGSGFVFTLNGHPLVGKGLIMGCDDEGESIGTTVDMSEVRAAIQWKGEHTFNL